MGILMIAWRTTVNYMKGSSVAGLCHAANAPSLGRIDYWYYEYSNVKSIV